MKNWLRWVLGIGASVLLIGIVAVIVIIFVFNSYFGASDEDIVKYVQKKHGVPSEVLISPTSYDAGSLKLDDATVVTLDEDEIEFSVQVSEFRHIESDTYEQKKKAYEANKTTLTSDSIQSLKSSGFREFTFDTEQKSVDFYMKLPETMEFPNEEVFSLIYGALPDLQSLREKTQESGNDVKTVSISGVYLDITKPYESVDDLKAEMKQENPESFDTYLSQKDLDTVDSIKSDLHSQGFNMERPTEEVLKCEDFLDDGKCVGIVYHLYTFGIEGSPEDTPIHYDKTEDLERLRKALLTLQSSDVPIRRVALHSLYAPQNGFYQDLPVEEVKEIEGTGEKAFGTFTAEISIMEQQFDELHQIQFNYNEIED